MMYSSVVLHRKIWAAFVAVFLLAGCTTSSLDNLSSGGTGGGAGKDAGGTGGGSSHVDSGTPPGATCADAVKNALIQAGVTADRINTIIYGKEKPFCTESNEQCWQQNRRGHFVYQK